MLRATCIDSTWMESAAKRGTTEVASADLDREDAQTQPRGCLTEARYEVRRRGPWIVLVPYRRGRRRMSRLDGEEEVSRRGSRGLWRLHARAWSPRRTRSVARDWALSDFWVPFGCHLGKTTLEPVLTTIKVTLLFAPCVLLSANERSRWSLPSTIGEVWEGLNACVNDVP